MSLLLMISHSFSCNRKIRYLYHLVTQHTNEQHMGPGQGRAGWPSQHRLAEEGRQGGAVVWLPVEAGFCGQLTIGWAVRLSGC